jgi:hypothetical protein
MTRLIDELEAVEWWLETNDYSGWDPFDGLTSRLFRATFLDAVPFARLAWIQLLKRSPINLRELALVPATCNPKTLGLVLSARVRRHGMAPRDGHLESARPLVRRLASMRCELTHAWGYPFPWQNRKFYAPPHEPNAVCTAFVVRGLLDFGFAARDDEAMRLALESLDFFTRTLRRTETAEGVCFSYTARDATLIHNVNLLCAATTAELGALIDDANARALAGRSADYTLAHQRVDGSWPYGEGPGQSWIDLFHTGYNLSALQRLATLLDRQDCLASRERGFRYFDETFVSRDGAPRYSAASPWPYDIHAAAQAILTYLEHRDTSGPALSRARTVYEWTNAHLRLSAGQYAYQKRRVGLRRIVYARWSQAWMYRALAELASAGNASTLEVTTATVDGTKSLA